MAGASRWHGSVNIFMAKMQALSLLEPGPVTIFFTSIIETGTFALDEVEKAILDTGAQGAPPRNKRLQRR